MKLKMKIKHFFLRKIEKIFRKIEKWSSNIAWKAQFIYHDEIAKLPETKEKYLQWLKDWERADGKPKNTN